MDEPTGWETPGGPAWPDLVQRSPRLLWPGWHLCRGEGQGALRGWELGSAPPGCPWRQDSHPVHPVGLCSPIRGRASPGVRVRGSRTKGVTPLWAVTRRTGRRAGLLAQYTVHLAHGQAASD